MHPADPFDPATPARKRRDLVIVTVGYAIAAAAAWTCLSLIQAHPLVEVLIADVVATTVIFGFSVAFRNSSWYDAYWSVAPPLIAAGLPTWGNRRIRCARC